MMGDKMYLPVFDGKYVILKETASNETYSTYLVEAIDGFTEFVMLTIKVPEISYAVSSVLKEKKSSIPRNIVEWQVQDFTLSLICEKNMKVDMTDYGKKSSSFPEKAERSRKLLKSFVPYEKENYIYQTLLSSESSITYDGNGEFSYEFPLDFSENILTSGKEALCENLNIHMNKIFRPEIEKESHLYYNAAPPELSGLFTRFKKNEISSTSDLYYAYTHCGFYKMFGDPAFVDESIGAVTIYRHKDSTPLRTITRKARKPRKPLIPISMTKEDAEKKVHKIGAMNFNNTLVRPSTNSNGMRYMRALRKMRIAIFIGLFVVFTPIIAHATGFDSWLSTNIKHTSLGGAILNNEPVARFTPDTGKILENIPVTFINQSIDTDPNDSIKSSYWIVTYQGATLYESLEMHMLYSFPSSGKYIVSLTVEDSRGKSSNIKTIEYKVSKPLKGSEIPGETIK